MDKRIIKALTNPRYAGLAIMHKLSPFIKNDELYLKIVYWLSMGKRLNLKNPTTFNEKLQWLKLYNRKPEYTVMVDKVKAKEYVAKIIGEEHIIPTLGVWDDPDEIDFDKLPNQFVLKCNHNSGMGMCICRDKSKLDIDKVKRELRKGLQQDYYMTNREWPYKNVPRKIMAEKFMQDGDKPDLNDYKFFCMNGKPEVLFVSSDRAKKVCFDYFDMDFKHLPLQQGGPNFPGKIDRPKHLEEMKLLAAKLSDGIPQVRVDFYDMAGQVYFGELTFFDSSGMAKFTPEEWDERLGKLIVLTPPYCGVLIANPGYILYLHMARVECSELTDYKFFCFNGEPFMMYVSHDNAEHATTDFFDMNYHRLPIRMKDPNSDNPPAKPREFEEMRKYARMLAKGTPHLRVDFYVINHTVYFGELTFFHNSGLTPIRPKIWEYKLGNLIKLGACLES